MVAHPTDARNRPESRDLTPWERRVVAAVLAARTIKEAAEALQRDESNVRRALRRAHVRAHLDTLSREMHGEALARLRSLTGAAADTLGELLDPREPSNVRARVALGIVDSLTRADRPQGGAVAIAVAGGQRPDLSAYSTEQLRAMRDDALRREGVVRPEGMGHPWEHRD